MLIKYIISVLWRVAKRLSYREDALSLQVKEAFGDNALGLTLTYEWFKTFKNGRMSVDDDERSGRPSKGTTTENVAKVRDAILEDRRRTIHDVCSCSIVGLSHDTCLGILSDELPCDA